MSDIAASMKTLKRDVASALDALREIDLETNSRLSWIPNLPSPDVPEGLDESANVEIRRWGETPSFSFSPREHYEIGESLGLMTLRPRRRYRVLGSYIFGGH